jgi:hypothetical protein
MGLSGSCLSIGSSLAAQQADVGLLGLLGAQPHTDHGGRSRAEHEAYEAVARLARRSCQEIPVKSFMRYQF